MSRIIFNLDEIEDIKNKLDLIIQRGQKIDPSEFKKLVKQNQTALPKFLDEHHAKFLSTLEIILECQTRM